MSSTFIKGNVGGVEEERSIYDKITRVSHSSSGSSRLLLFQAVSNKFGCTSVRRMYLPFLFSYSVFSLSLLSIFISWRQYNVHRALKCLPNRVCFSSTRLSRHRSRVVSSFYIRSFIKPSRNFLFAASGGSSSATAKPHRHLGTKAIGAVL